MNVPRLRPSLWNAFREGAGNRRRHRLAWAVSALLWTTATLAAVITVTLAVDREIPDGVMMETPVPDGAWAVSWGSRAETPAVEQQRQFLSLRRVGAGVAGIVSLLGFLALVSIWRQRLELRRREDFVTWAVGARPVHFLVRSVGEGWRWAAAAGLAAASGGALVFGLMANSFPGEFTVPPDLAAAVVVSVGVGVLLFRFEVLAGRRAAGGRSGRVTRASSSPVTLAALGFAALVGVGLLLEHGPRAPGAREGAAALPPSIVAASLPGGSSEDRSALIGEWTTALQERGGRAGFASAGTVRGTGHRDRVWVDCGRCFEGGLPLPVRTVSAEVHAVAPDTFTHLGLTLEEGRDFIPADGSAGAAVVSRALAARHFQDGRAVGRRIRVGESEWVRVVGIVDDRVDARGHFDYTVYLPIVWAAPSELEVLPDPGDDGLLRASAPADVRLAAVLPGATAFGALPWVEELMGWLGIAVVVLVAVGIRTGAAADARAGAFDMALRRALGAGPWVLRRYYAGRTVRRVGGALAAGAWLSLFLGNGLNEAYGGIPLVDLRIWAGAALVVATAWLVGSAGPVRRALAAPPAAVLASAE